MELYNMYAAWIGIVAGCLSGAVIGLFFHKKEWLGGYGARARRMVRLGHISFFGLAIINTIFALSVSSFALFPATPLASSLLICGAVSMPAICFLTAWKPSFRHLFFIPVLSLLVGIIYSLIQGKMI
jgi:hypothetical protein